MHSLICSSHWLFNCMRANTDQMWLGYTTQTTNGNQKSCPLLTDSTFLSVKIGFRQSHYLNLWKYSRLSKSLGNLLIYEPDLTADNPGDWTEINKTSVPVVSNYAADSIKQRNLLVVSCCVTNCKMASHDACVHNCLCLLILGAHSSVMSTIHIKY